ncbi:MAG: hypothetical protein QXK84_03330 [Nitrososphaerota archaeon]
MIYVIDYSGLIALPLTFISVFCLLINIDYRTVIASAALFGFIIGLGVVVGHYRRREEAVKITWQRIEKLYDLLSIVLGTDCALIMIYHYGRTVSKNLLKTLRDDDDQIINKLERQMLTIMHGWRYALSEGRLVHQCSSGISTSRCNHPVCSFLLGFAEDYLEEAVNYGLLPSGKYLLRSCREGSAILDFERR